MYVYVYIRACIYMFACTCVCVFIWAHVHVCLYGYMRACYACTWVQRCTYACAYICVCVYMWVCMCVYASVCGRRWKNVCREADTHLLSMTVFLWTFFARGSIFFNTLNIFCFFLSKKCLKNIMDIFFIKKKWHEGVLKNSWFNREESDF